MFLKRGGMKQTFFCQLDDWLEEKRREAEARYTPDFLPPYNDFIYRDEAGEWVMTIPSRERAIELIQSTPNLERFGSFGGMMEAMSFGVVP